MQKSIYDTRQSSQIGGFVVMSVNQPVNWPFTGVGTNFGWGRRNDRPRANRVLRDERFTGTPGLSSLIEDCVAFRGDVYYSIEEFDPGSD